MPIDEDVAAFAAWLAEQPAYASLPDRAFADNDPAAWRALDSAVWQYVTEQPTAPTGPRAHAEATLWAEALLAALELRWMEDRPLH